MFKFSLTVYFILNAALVVAAPKTEYDSEYTKQLHAKVAIGTCLDSSQLDFRVTSAVDKNHYMIEAWYSGHVVVGRTSRGVLETTNTVITQPGRIHKIGMKYLGAKDLPLENGFTAKFGLWRECE